MKLTGFTQAMNIIEWVSGIYGIKVKDLKGPRRTKTLANARVLTYALLRRLTNLSYPEIGILLNRDHSTVVKGVQSVDQEDVRELERRMGAA